MQSVNNEKYKRMAFYLLIGLIFFMLLAYNGFTPYLSDDISYKNEVDTAKSFWDLIKQQYGEYLSNSGRVIGQFNIRLSLLGSKWIFNVINSIMFVILTLLIYVNISARKKNDHLLYLLIVGMLFWCSVEFGQTMLWICGACNYLWGSVFILGFITFYRSRLNKAADSKHPILLAIGTFFFGVLSGWCNENTSGGGLLLIMAFTMFACLDRKSVNRKKKIVLPYMITAHIGMLVGLAGMISAPGIDKRAAAMSDNYTGLLAYVSRFYKCTMTIRDLFFPLLILFIVVTVLAVLGSKGRQDENRESYLFFFAAAATAYALIMAPPPADRAYFGTGIFLLIACLQGFAYILTIVDYQKLINPLKYIAVSVLMLWLFFTYMENLVNLARIYREDMERHTLMQEASEARESIVVIPQYREAFANPYSNAHNSDMQEDPKYWINHFYEEYYKIGRISAIPREEWDELYAEEE